MSLRPTVLASVPMAGKNITGYSDLQYFSQLRRQAEGALSKTERSASSLVAQVLQVHALLGASVGSVPTESSRGSTQRALQQGALTRMREKVRRKLSCALCMV